ncbi:MAG: IS200/IS605 family transposase [Bacteroidetes bacterium]|jgi:REP element-mobilizing transposase RayT|nr:IS200/IS605 family transposase [Bacteroidota bacterium]
MRSSGNLVRIYLHFNWSTKNRVPNIDEESERIIMQVVRSKAIELGLYIVAFNGTQDHIHVLASMPPMLSPSEVVKHFKGASAFAINKARAPRMARFEWQRGFAVISVSPEAVKRIRKYIEGQKEHHAQNQLISDLEMDGEVGTDE